MVNEQHLKRVRLLQTDLTDFIYSDTKLGKDLLEEILDDYLYLVDNNRLDELENIIVNEFEELL